MTEVNGNLTVTHWGAHRDGLDAGSLHVEPFESDPEGAENVSLQVTVRSAGTVTGMLSVLPRMLRLLITRLGLLLVSGDKSDTEILALRHQIFVL